MTRDWLSTSINRTSILPLNPTINRAKTLAPLDVTSTRWQTAGGRGDESSHLYLQSIFLSLQQCRLRGSVNEYSQEMCDKLQWHNKKVLFQGVWMWRTHLAETSTTSSLSSRLRKVFLGVKVTLKAGSTGAQHAVKNKAEPCQGPTCNSQDVVKSARWCLNGEQFLFHLPYFFTSNWEENVFCCQSSNFTDTVHIPSLPDTRSYERKVIKWLINTSLLN